MLNSIKFLKYVKNSRINDNFEKMEEMINRGFNLNFTDNIYDYTPLMTAIHFSKKTSNIITVQKLIEYGASVNFVNNNTRTALMIACYNFNIEVVKILIDNGANLNLQSNNGFSSIMILQTALNFIELENDENIVMILQIMSHMINNGVNINLKNDNKDDILSIAVNNSKYYGIGQIKLLIEKAKMNINSRYKSNKTPLILACYFLNISSSYEAIEYIINNGADINVCDKRGYTPLMYLVCKSHNITTELIDAIKLLINNGADMNIKSNDSHSALSIACINAVKSGNISILKLLINSGADVNIKFNFNANCLSYLVYKGRDLSLRLIDSFIDNGVDMNIQSSNTLNGNYDGYTLLHYAAQGIVEKTSMNEVIKILIQNGTDPSIKNNKGQTYEDILIKQKEIQKYISSKCLVCLEENIQSMYMLDCGHCVSCELCSNEIIKTSHKCPYCREIFKQFENIKFID
jgi:ankyrin repeat protein